MKLYSQFSLFLTLLLFLNYNLFSDASVQVFHNSADPQFNSVDIYVNGQKPSQLDDFNYKEASPFIPIPAGIDIIVTVANSSSANVMDGVIETFNLGKLEDNKEYVVIANGVEGQGFNSGESGRDISFDLKVIDGKSQSGSASEIAVSFYHGVTDAGRIDVYIAKDSEAYSETPQISNLNYAEATDFINLTSGYYKIKVTATANKDLIIGEYSAPLSTAAGAGAIVVATGFVSPEDEAGGLDEGTYGFNMLAVTPFGFVIPLPQQDFAFVQVIHNVSDPTANQVDVYVNGIRVGDNLNFRNATAFIPVVAGEPINISINEATSSGQSNLVIKSFELSALEKEEELTVVANGVLSDGFNTPDDMRDIELTSYSSEANTTTIADSIIINVFHGVTDAPAVDIYADIDSSPLISNLDYGNYTGLLTLPASDYELTITAAGDKSTVVGKYAAPLSAPIGNITVFASGFLTPEDEPGSLSEEEFGFGVFAALSIGNVIELEEVEENEDDVAYLQIIHNCADPLAKEVDIYLNGTLTLDNFAFQSATEYIPLIASSSYTVSINNSTSESVDDGQIATYDLDGLMPDGEYIAIASGVAGFGFNSGDESRDISFNLEIIEGKRESFNEEVVTINAFHGVTDAPAIDVLDDTGELIIGNLDYVNSIDWSPFEATQDWDIVITAANSPETIVGTYFLPITQYKGEAILILASGFLTPEDEPISIDIPFKVLIVRANGDVEQLEVASVINKDLSDNTLLFPNPASEQIEINIDNAIAKSYKIFTSNSELVLENNTNLSKMINIDVSTFNSGSYFILIETDDGTVFKKFIVNR